MRFRDGSLFGDKHPLMLNDQLSGPSLHFQPLKRLPRTQHLKLIPRRAEVYFNALLDSFMPALIRTGLSPNVISTAGCASQCAAGMLLLDARFHLAGVLILLGGLFDALDGKLARTTLRASPFGAVYDATMDRIGELAIYAGIGGYFMLHRMLVLTCLVACATAGSLLVSYVRARAEASNVSCKIGILRRSERILLLGLGSLLNFRVVSTLPVVRSFMATLHLPKAVILTPLTLALATIALLAPVTIAQRLNYVKAQVRVGA